MDANDNKLVEEYLRGREEAFAELLKKYLTPVHNFLYRITNSKEVAEDISQDAFLKVWKNMRRFDQNRNFKTWLFAIAKNTAFDYLRKKKELPFSMFADEEGANGLEEIKDEEMLSDEILERKDITRDLENVLEKIPEYYRAVLLLHYKEDFTLHEVAEIIGDPYNTIKSRHQRALARLKKAILSS